MDKLHAGGRPQRERVQPAQLPVNESRLELCAANLLSRKGRQLHGEAQGLASLVIPSACTRVKTIAIALESDCTQVQVRL